MDKEWHGRIRRGVFGSSSRSLPKNKLCNFCKEPVPIGGPVFYILKRSNSGRLVPFIKICEPCSERTIQETAVIQALMD